MFLTVILASLRVEPIGADEGNGINVLALCTVPSPQSPSALQRNIKAIPAS
jgi:hypothetical protein